MRWLYECIFFFRAHHSTLKKKGNDVLHWLKDKEGQILIGILLNLDESCAYVCIYYIV